MNPGFRFLALLLLTGLLCADDEGKTVAPPTKGVKVKKAINRVFRGRVVKIKKKRVTLYYDFEDKDQLKDFEPFRPPRLLDASENRITIRGGRLVLEGSSALRHRMEGKGEYRAQFTVRCGRQHNIGTIFTEPVLSDFFVVFNLFDQRFYNDGSMFLAACGLHEDEGADTDMALVNFRDIFKSNVRKKVKVGQEAEVEVYKDGWTEYCRVEDVEGKGSSKGKCKYFETYQFGFWVHDSHASFDDLTLNIEVPDEFLDLYELEAAIDLDWEEIPSEGPLKGVKGVPPRIRTTIEDYGAGRGDARKVFSALVRTGLPKKAREAAAKVLCDRKDPKTVPLVIDGLYHPDATTRKLSIAVVKCIVGKTFGYSPTAAEKVRAKAVQKLNAHLAEHRDRYFG